MGNRTDDMALCQEQMVTAEFPSFLTHRAVPHARPLTTPDKALYLSYPLEQL